MTGTPGSECKRWMISVNVVVNVVLRVPGGVTLRRCEQFYLEILHLHGKINQQCVGSLALLSSKTFTVFKANIFDISHKELKLSLVTMFHKLSL